MSWRTNPQLFDVAKKTVAPHSDHAFAFIKVAKNADDAKTLDELIEEAKSSHRAIVLMEVLERLQKYHSDDAAKLFEELVAEVRSTKPFGPTLP